MGGQDTSEDGVADGRVPNRRSRLVAPAVTPLRFRDLVAGGAAQIRGTGRERFVRSLEAFFDAEAVATYTSFRRALCASLRTLSDRGRPDADTVLLPAFCSSDYADAIAGAGLSVRRYDVDPATLSADLDSLADSRTDDVLALVVVNVLGYGSPMDEVVAFCEDADVRLIEALGYAVGSEYRGRRLGTFGDCAVINFQQGKPIPVGGGAVVSQDPGLDVGDADRPAVESNPATLAGYKLLSHPRSYALYEHVARPIHDWIGNGEDLSTHPESKIGLAYEPPFSTMSDYQCAVADRVFRRLDEHRRARARTAEFYATELADAPAVERLSPVAGLSKHQHVRYPILLVRSDLRSDVQSKLAAVGIRASKLYSWPKVDADLFPGGASLQQRILTLPTHPYVDDLDRRLAVDRIRQVGQAAVTNGPGGV